MRDLFAAVVVALACSATAASLATTLQVYRRRRNRARDSERALGRTIIAEIPDARRPDARSARTTSRFYYGERSIDKDLIVAVRVLINGAPIAAYVSRRHPEGASVRRPASRTGPKASPATAGTSPSKRSPARRWSSAAPSANASHRSSRAPSSTR